MQARTAHPIRNGAVNDSLPELFIRASLAVKNKTSQDMLLLDWGALLAHNRNGSRWAQWPRGPIVVSTRGSVCDNPRLDKGVESQMTFAVRWMVMQVDRLVP